MSHSAVASLRTAQPSTQPVAKTSTTIKYVPTVRTVLTPSKPQPAPLPSTPAPSATASGITSSADLLSRIAGANAAVSVEGEISRLLTLFPKAKRVNIPMLVRVVADGKEVWDWEKDWIMYVASDSAIFPSNLPLRGNETLMFRRPGESEMMPGVIVAMQHEGARVIVAVRFLNGLPEWLNTAN